MMGFNTKLPSNWTVTMEGSENVACKKDGRFSPQEKGKECNMDSWFTSVLERKMAIILKKEWNVLYK